MNWLKHCAFRVRQHDVRGDGRRERCRLTRIGLRVAALAYGVASQFERDVVGHHAQAAEAEHLDLDGCVRDHVPDLRQRQHARQHGVDAVRGGAVERLAPQGAGAGLRIHVQREEDLKAVRMGVADGIGDGRFGKIQAGEVARIGRVAKAEVDAVGAVVDGGLPGRQAAGGTNEFERRAVELMAGCQR